MVVAFKCLRLASEGKKSSKHETPNMTEEMVVAIERFFEELRNYKIAKVRRYAVMKD